jgi:hypothetical protein
MTSSTKVGPIFGRLDDGGMEAVSGALAGFLRNWQPGGSLGINILLFSLLQTRQRPADRALRDALQLAEQVVIDVVIFAPLTGSG